MAEITRRLARKALAGAREALPAYACPTSRKDFTPAVHHPGLKAFLTTDSRGGVAFRDDFPELRQDLGLAKVPHYSTLCYAEQRLLPKGGSVSSRGGPAAAPGCAA